MNDTIAHSQWTRSFLLKDLVDHGLSIMKGKGAFDTRPHARSLSDVLPAILAADNLYEEGSGAPNYELHVWLALATMLIGAGDVIFSGTQAHVHGRILDSGHEVTKWEFALNFSDTEGPWLESLEDSHKRMLGEGGVMDTSVHHGRFLTIKRLVDERMLYSGANAVADIVAKYTPAMSGFAWRAMGEITEKDLAVKMVSYPASVHPQMKDRTVANIPLYIVAKLGDAGLSVREHWFPEDTSRSFARYILSDGIDHFVMDFHGGHLAVLLSHLDKYISRGPDIGGIELDVIHPTVIALDQAGDALDSLSMSQLP